jgi:hypothetical protein
VAKFKQIDKRPQETFRAGDVVDYHPSLTNHKPIKAGVVVLADEYDRHTKKVNRVLVLVSSTEVELRQAAAEVGQKMQAESIDYITTAFGTVAWLDPHTLVKSSLDGKDNLSSWFELPTMEELDMIRHEILSEGLFDESDILGS